MVHPFRLWHAFSKHPCAFCLFHWTLFNIVANSLFSLSCLNHDAIPGDCFEVFSSVRDPSQPCCHNDLVLNKLLISFRSCDGSKVPYFTNECTLPWCCTTLQVITDFVIPIWFWNHDCVEPKVLFFQPAMSTVHYQFRTLSFLMHEPCIAQSLVPWDKMHRLGEAKNPGPSNDNTNKDFSIVDCITDPIILPDNPFTLGVVNPSGLHGKVGNISSLGKGVWAITETHSTFKAIKMQKKELKVCGFNSEFSPPVPPSSTTRNDTYRGVASGVSCISTLPMRGVFQDHPQHIINSCRFLSSHISLGPHCVVLVITIYAPPPNNKTIYDPNALTSELLSYACQVLQSWKGPAILAGDFNQNIAVFECIQKLFDSGWKDAQRLSALKNNHPMKPTCVTAQGSSNHSNILCSPLIAQSLIYCNALDDFLFPGHPTLAMFCDMRAVTQTQLYWHLPTPFECNSFDHDTLNYPTLVEGNDEWHAFQDAINSQDVEKAADVWIKHSEHALSRSALDANGERLRFSRAHFGRTKGPSFRQRPNGLPVNHLARPGEVNSTLKQTPTWFRQHLRQARRLQTLQYLVAARDRNPSVENQRTCAELWDAIKNAQGFRHGFPKWATITLQWVFPQNLPCHEMCQTFARSFHQYFASVDDHFKKVERDKLSDVFEKDWAKGGSKSFAGIREEGPQQLCYVAKTKRFKICRVRWPKQGRTSICCHEAHEVDLNFPLTFQGQTVKVVGIQDKWILLDQPLVLKNGNDFCASQRIIIFDVQSATNEVVSTWNAFLKRDEAHMTDGWTEAERIVEMIPQQSEITVPDYNFDLWTRTQASTPVKSARGSCGFTVREMRVMPEWLVQLLFQIFRLVDASSKWPRVWLFAFTVMLPKSNHPESPLDLRPITILSRIYRQWSRYKAISILVGISNRIPNVIAGGTQNMSSLLLSAFFQETLESEPRNSECNGVTIDIIKCYNVIPRYPLSLLMRKLGWPVTLIRAYLSALMNMKRSFQVLGTVSTWQVSFTGVPEGCALAVAAMLTLSASLFFYMQIVSPESQLFTFADNWALKFLRASHTPKGIEALEKFCQAFKLTISVPKSWIWTLNPKTANELDEVTLQGTKIPLVKHTKDLGVDLTYRGKKTKTHLKHRLALGLQRCLKVAKTQNQPKQKQKLLTMSCFPKAAYGVELISPNKSDFKSYRTASARALALSKKGASPWIALNLVCPKSNDFEYHTIERTILFWRQYIRIFPSRLDEIKRKLVQPTKRGPIGNLHSVLVKLGHVTGDGTYLETKFSGTIQWTRCSKSHLKHVMKLHWNAFVCTYLTKLPRKNFSCVGTDVEGFTRVTKKLPPVDLQILKTHCSGTNYTNDIKAKYLDVAETCPLCSCNDSKHHRLFHCQGLADERSKMSQETIDFANQNPTLAHFSILPIPEDVLTIRNLLPDESFDYDSCVFPNVDPAELPLTHVFTDGSCYHNTDHLFALAGAAYQTYGFVGQCNPSNSCREILPGKDHNSYRAEAYAILMVCRKYRNCIIYTDCQSVKGELTMILDAIRLGNTPSFQNHADLWEAIYQVILRGKHCIEMIKVKAHTEHMAYTDPEMRWRSQCNTKVDSEAKRAITIDHQELFDQFNAKFDTLCKHRQALHEIVHFQISSAHKVFLASANQLDRARESTFFGKGNVPENDLIRWSCQVDMNSCDRCPINATFLHRLATWAHGMHWQISNQHVSFFELMLSFIFDTNSYPPFPVRKYPNNPSSRIMVWQLRDLHPTTDFQGYNMGNLLSGFIRTVNWAEKHLETKLFAGDHKPDVSSLSKYGFRAIKVPGYQARPILPKQELIDVYCNKYLSGKNKIDFPIP